MYFSFQLSFGSAGNGIDVSVTCPHLHQTTHVTFGTHNHISEEHTITVPDSFTSSCRTARYHMYPHPARQQTACTPPKHTRMIPSPTDPSKSVPVKFTAILLFPSMSLWTLKRFPSGPTLVCCLTHDAMYECSKCTSV